MMQKKFSILFITFSIALHTFAQRGLVNTNQSPFAVMQTMGINDVSWTSGFWKERFSVCRDIMFPQLWQTYTSDTICYAFKNFKVAAGMETGRFRAKGLGLRQGSEALRFATSPLRGYLAMPWDIAQSAFGRFVIWNR